MNSEGFLFRLSDFLLPAFCFLIYMGREWLYGLNLWLVFGFTVALLVVSIEVGFQLGNKRKGEDSDPSQISTLENAVLGLLALLLAFTFSMALARYDARKQLVLAEANAIGTAFLRAQLLPPPDDKEITNLLRQYVDVRLEFYGADLDEVKVREESEKTERLHQQIWSHAIDLSAKDERSGAVRLFIESINEVMDFHEKRLTAMRDHVPETVFLTLYMVAAVGLGFVGYSRGFSGRRHFLVTLILAILISTVITLIADLDRPRRGLIKVSQQSMLDLRQSLEKAGK
jgi:Protein of unknown function (DUF4239)